MNKDRIIEIIIEETNAILDEPVDKIDLDTSLFGKDGLLDSMGLVSMIVAVEQDIEDECNVQITIADAKAMSQKHSPFSTVNTLANYIDDLIKG